MVIAAETHHQKRNHQNNRLPIQQTSLLSKSSIVNDPTCASTGVPVTSGGLPTAAIKTSTTTTTHDDDGGDNGDGDGAGNKT